MSPFDACQKEAQNFTAGVLLYRLYGLQQGTKITRGGKEWVAWTQAQWMAGMNLSRDRLKRAFKRLEDRCLIERERHLIANKQRVFCRVTNATFERIALGTQSNQTPFGESTGAPIYIDGEENGEEDVSVCNHGCEDHLSGCEGVSGEGDDQMKAKDVLASIQGKVPETKPNTVKDLEMQWKTCMSEEYEHTMVKVTQKMRGQMKHFISFCPPGKASEIFANTLAKWDEFASDAQHAAGLKTFPNEPNMGFMLMHSDVAIKLFNEPDTYAPPPKPAVMKPKPVLPPKPATVHDDPDDPLPTLAEILDLKAELKDIEPAAVPAMLKLSGKMVKSGKKPS